MSVNYIQSAIRTIKIESQAVNDLLQHIDNNFNQVCDLLLQCKGRIIITGMGKSGHIARKIAATLSSTGSPAFYIHPAEASHGDLGMITPLDVVIAISYSGASDEIINLIPTINRIQCPLISITGNAESILAKNAHVHLSIKIKEEACPLGLAPTSSTTVSLVMGDALAIALLEARGFTAEEFALSHPSGSLGKRLLLKVSDVMCCGDAIPMVKSHVTLKDAIVEITTKGLGVTTIVDEQYKLLGIFTDGDLRRVFEQENVLNTPISQLMSVTPKTIAANAMAIDALAMMENAKITSLIITNNNSSVIGIIHLHDLLETGL